MISRPAESERKDLVQQLLRYGRWGWLVLFILLCALIVSWVEQFKGYDSRVGRA